MEATIGNALMILRYIAERGRGAPRHARRIDIIDYLCISEDEFRDADVYLIGKKYVVTTLGGTQGHRALTPEGTDFSNHGMQQRIPLSLNAERILCLAVELERSDCGTSIIGAKEIQDQLGIDFAEYRDAAQELADEGLIIEVSKDRNWPFLGILPSPEGRKALRRGFRLETPVQGSTVAIGPVSHSNVLAVGEAYQSHIEQVISQSTDELRDEIEGLLTNLVEAVRPELSEAQMAAYSAAANELRKEIVADPPDPSALQRLLGSLSFASDVSGTIDLSEKLLRLSLLVAPLIEPLRLLLVTFLDRVSS